MKWIKRFLISIVMLVAVVMLTSPAFGALITFDDTVTSNSGIWMYTISGNDSNDDSLESHVNTWLADNEYDPINALSVYDKEEGFPDNNVGSGYWETDLPITFYSLKSAKQYAMFYVNPAANEGTFTTEGFLINPGGNTPDLSHITFYNPSPVPIPSAIWLLGSGVLGIVAVRRRRS